jgi:hypothetical protein
LELYFPNFIKTQNHVINCVLLTKSVQYYCRLVSYNNDCFIFMFVLSHIWMFSKKKSFEIYIISIRNFLQSNHVLQRTLIYLSKKKEAKKKLLMDHYIMFTYANLIFFGFSFFFLNQKYTIYFGYIWIPFTTKVQQKYII